MPATPEPAPHPLLPEACATPGAPCNERDVSDFNPFAQQTGGGAAYYPEEEPTVEEILEEGLYQAGGVAGAHRTQGAA